VSRPVARNPLGSACSGMVVSDAVADSILKSSRSSSFGTL
jgi:hypothetical protein